MAKDTGPTLEERVAKVEGILEQMNERLNHLESDISGLRGDINGLRGDMNSLREDMHGEIARLRADLQTNFRWLIGFVVGTWITLMLTLLFKL